jgi:Flp pilus assembly protein CpaB
MKSKTFVLMFLAIGCGLVAAYLTARITAKQAAPDTVPVLVAKEKIKAGDVIKDPEKVFVEMRYPQGTTPNAISNTEDLKGKMVNKTIQPGQWVTPDDISANFGIELPKGYYGMSVKVSAETGASGFILPKSRVNVVATIRPSNNRTRPRVVTVLQDVLVLAVDTMAQRPEDKIAIGGLSTALLAVKPADSQKLAYAQSVSDLRLVLRPHDDEEKQLLQPLEQLDADLGYSEGHGGTFGGSGRPDAPAQTYRLAVAKKDLEAGTKIDDPEQLFEVRSFVDVPDKALAPEELASLKGKTLKVPVFKDGVLTQKHFDEKLAAVVVAGAVERKRHMLFIQNGGNAPQVTTFVDGSAAGDESRFLSLPPEEKGEKPEPAKQPTTKPETAKPDPTKPDGGTIDPLGGRPQ